MRARSLLSVRNSFCTTRQVRWKSQRPTRYKPSLDPTKYTATGFVSLNLRGRPVDNSSPKSAAPPKSAPRVELSAASNEPSLFAELFPEEAQKNGNSQPLNDESASKFPPLELPTVAELLEGVEGYHPTHLTHSRATSKEASNDAKSHKKTTLLVLEVASKSLVESDFRRIAPKGEHIAGWTGLGDILRGEFCMAKGT